MASKRITKESRDLEKDSPASCSVGSLKSNNDASLKESHVDVEISDSDDEGFIEKTPTSSHINDKSSSKTKSGKKKVSFASLKSSGVDTPTTGDGGKGGKSVNAGGKGSLPQETPIKVAELELKLDLELPKGARLLMDCEAAEILQDIQEDVTVLSEDPDIKIPESFSKALQYSKINAHYTNVQSVRQVLETLKLNEATDAELCMIGNVCPESVDEVYALIPSLKAKRHKNEVAHFRMNFNDIFIQAKRHKNEVAITDVVASLAKFRASK